MANHISRHCDWPASLLATLTLLAASASAGDREMFFERQVRPLLARHCFACHGSQKQEGGLRLDSAAAFKRGGERGPVVVPGKPRASLLLSAIERRGVLKMPPVRPLSKGAKAVLTRWVSEGAHWPARNEVMPAPDDSEQQLWSLKPVQDPVLPRLQDESWCRAPVDYFIRSRLESVGLAPTRQLSRAALLRRVSLDLNGLPPTLDELDRFTNAPAPDAYGRIVDRLLASPSYGERWGRHWLDVVRYCDSRDARHTGQAYDVNEAWRYRDWVVNAFNRDLPYDAFVRQQIAGDILPVTDSQEDAARGLIATGMLVIGEWGSGDADAKKMYTDIVDDQIHVVTQAFLGVSLSCARCHDHKFDPFTTRDYYAMAGIFFSTQIATPRTDAPLMRVPLLTARDRNRRARLQADVAEIDRKLKGLEEMRRNVLRNYIAAQTSRYLQAVWELEEQRLLAIDQQVTAEVIARKARQQELDPIVLAAWDRSLGERIDQGDVLRLGQPGTPVAGVFCWKTAAVQPLFLINTNPYEVRVPGRMAPHSVAVHPTPTRGVAVAWRSPIDGNVEVRGKVRDVHDGGNGIEWALERSRGIDVATLHSGAIGRGGMAAIREDTTPLAVRVGDRIRLVITAKANNHVCDLTRLELEIKETGASRRVWQLCPDLLDNPGMGNPHADAHGHPAVWQFLHMARRRTLQRPAFRALEPWFTAVANLNAQQVRAAAAAIEGKLLNRAADDGATHALSAWLVSPDGLLGQNDRVALSTAGEKQRTTLRSMRATIEKQLAPAEFALAAREGGVPGTTHAGYQDARVHVRGNYARLGERVPRGFPQILAGGERPPINEGSGRAELAEWISRDTHPLTPRVMANRIWMHHFGAALVRTPGDFGTQGLPPTHPLLLDWLANRLRTSGWSIKTLHRLIVMSATYQQGAGVPSNANDRKAREVDPDNRWLARVDSRRLEVEAIRDSLLAVAGVLDRRMGGPSAPRYPGGYSRTERKTAVFSSRRRALYLMTIRGESSDGPFVLDAADPNRVVHKRTISTTAPQALLLLNDPFIRGVAEALSERVRSAGDVAVDTRVRQLYRLLYGRSPLAQELAAARSFLGTMETDVESWDEYCHALLCTSELIYRN